MNIKWLCIISGGLLLLAIPTGWPYDFYILLRWVIFAIALIVAYNFYSSKLQSWAITFLILAVLFNPLFPINLAKSTWIIFDLVGAGIFFLAAFSNKIKVEHKKGKEEFMEVEIIEKEKSENIFKRFYHKHETYFSYVYGFAFVIGYIYGIIVLLRSIFDSIREGDFISFVISIIFSSVIMILNGFIVGIFLGTILAIILFLPYLVIRGLRN